MASILQLKELLDKKAAQYNRPGFVENDPISIPHAFSKPQDIEIAGLFAAILAWGNRKTIINKCRELMQRMDNSPHDFITQHQENDLKQLTGFKHRTFQDTDLLYFVAFLRYHYERHSSLESAFAPPDPKTASGPNIGPHLRYFHNYFFSLPYAPRRTRKHVPTPARQSACKRLAMYLRWMVRRDQQGVDFGLWQKIKPAQLVCPCDVHVVRTSLRLGLLQKEQVNWRAAVALTDQLKQLDPLDPVRYDFALFGMGLESRYGS